MNLKVVFWDYKELQDPEAIRHFFEKSSESGQLWVLHRFLEHGRVVDTFAFFHPSIIKLQLHKLRLRPYTLKKWERILDIYGER